MFYNCRWIEPRYTLSCLNLYTLEKNMVNDGRQNYWIDFFLSNDSSKIMQNNMPAIDNFQGMN